MRLAVVLLVAVLAGCASGTADTPPSPSPVPAPAEVLPGEDWVLLDAPAAPDAPRFAVTLRFEDGRVSGKAPVNTYFGPAAFAGEGLTLGPLARTEMAGPPAAMAAEEAYVAALSEVSTWQVGDGMLMLGTQQGAALVFAAPGSTGAFAVTLLGLPRAEAKAAAEDAGYAFRVVAVDGVSRPVTLDYRPDRINATIEDGLVTKVSVG
jgi:heat shock protein HslJ